MLKYKVENGKIKKKHKLKYYNKFFLHKIFKYLAILRIQLCI